MTATEEKVIHKLNELVEINNDRIDGYEKALKETEDLDLKDLFNNMASHSRSFKNELAGEIKKSGGAPTESTTTSGKLFRAWMDVKSALTGRNRKAILSACETGEDTALDVYRDILSEENTLTREMKEMIEKQKSELQKDHDYIKTLREDEKKDIPGTSGGNVPTQQNFAKQENRGTKQTFGTPVVKQRKNTSPR